jgi:hypothetical protein
MPTVTVTAAGESTTVDYTPAAGPLWGAAFQTTADCTPVENPAGRPVGVHRTYWVPGQEVAALAQSRADVAAGRVPWVSYKLPVTWAQAKTGAADTWARSITAGLATLPGPVMLTWHHEPEGDQSPLSDFVAMHDRLYQFSRPFPNIRCGPILTGYNQIFGTDPAQKPAAMWPGEFTSGDFFGMDAYMYWGTVKGRGVLLDRPEVLDPDRRVRQVQGCAVGDRRVGDQQGRRRQEPVGERRGHDADHRRLRHRRAARGVSRTVLLRLRPELDPERVGRDTGVAPRPHHADRLC